MKLDTGINKEVCVTYAELAKQALVVTNSSPNVYMKWEDVVKQYPFCWILLSDVEYTVGMNILGGIVRYISTNKSDKLVEYSFSHDNCEYTYTSDVCRLPIFRE